MSMKSRILLVEDDSEQASLFADVLTMVGYDVVATDDAETALPCLPAGAFDLALVDWDLPVMKGDAFITLVKERFPGIKTILFSNHTNVDEGGRASHADAWMVKSDGIKRLREMVAGLLRAA